MIYELIFKLSNDPRLRRNKLNKADAIMVDTLNFICNKIYKKNITSSKNINRDKHKDIGECALSNRLEFLETMSSSIDNKISEIEDEINNINYMYIMDKKDIDKLHLLNDKIKEFMIQLKQDLKKIFNKENLLC